MTMAFIWIITFCTFYICNGQTDSYTEDHTTYEQTDNLKIETIFYCVNKHEKCKSIMQSLYYKDIYNLTDMDYYPNTLVNNMILNRVISSMDVHYHDTHKLYSMYVNVRSTPTSTVRKSDDGHIWQRSLEEYFMIDTVFSGDNDTTKYDLLKNRVKMVSELINELHLNLITSEMALNILTNPIIASDSSGYVIEMCSRNKYMVYDSIAKKAYCLCYSDKNCEIDIESVVENEVLHPLLIIFMILFLILFVVRFYSSVSFV